MPSCSLSLVVSSISHDELYSTVVSADDAVIYDTPSTRVESSERNLYAELVQMFIRSSLP